MIPWLLFLKHPAFVGNFSLAFCTNCIVFPIEPFYVQIFLKLHYEAWQAYFSDPPEDVRIVGDNTVRADRSVSYRCHADNANPAPTLQWSVNGQPTTTGISTHVQPPAVHGLMSSSLSRRRTHTGSEEHLGWSVSSDLTLDVIGDEREIAITCQSVSKDFVGQTMIAKAELKILVLSKYIHSALQVYCKCTFPKQIFPNRFFFTKKLEVRLRLANIFFQGRMHSGCCFWENLILPFSQKMCLYKTRNSHPFI